MVLFTPEGTDSVPKNAKVIPAGSYAFIHIAVRETNNGPLVPLDGNWADVGSSIFTIKDPDGTPVAWNTNNIDPTDASDDYDENRASYVGNQLTPEAIGLHASLSGGLPVRLAVKVKVPVGAEQTSSNTDRNYTIEWQLTKNGGVIPNAIEQFNVGPSGTPVFSGDLVTPDDVRCEVNTNLSNEDLECIIAKAEMVIKGKVAAMCSIDPDQEEVNAASGLLTDAILQQAVLIVLRRDASSGGAPIMKKEGRKEIRYSGSANGLQALRDAVHGDILHNLTLYCSTRSSPVKLRSFRQSRTNGIWGDHDA